MTDYALWDIIENGNSFNLVAQTTTNADGTSASTIPGPVTTEEKTQKKNDVKAKSMLLMALLNEHQLTFNQYKDAKTLFEAIQTRFGGNDATKKTQKTLLKQMYENFNAPSTESLDSIFNRLQKIVSQLAILGSQNVAFVSTPSSTNEVNTTNIHVSTASSIVSTDSTHDNTANLSDATVYAFLVNQPNGSQLVHEDLEQIHEDDLEEMDLKCQLALLSIRARKYYQRTGKKITINGSDTAGYDKSKEQVLIRATLADGWKSSLPSVLYAFSHVQSTPSPDYVPGPEHPPSPVYVAEPEYLDYLVPSNAEAPMEDQPLSTDASPTALSSDCIADSNTEDDEEDPQEDPADYPVDGGHDDDDESSNDDNDDDDVEEDKEEEEHLASADSSVVPIDDHMSVQPYSPPSPSIEACIAEFAAALPSSSLPPSVSPPPENIKSLKDNIEASI
ncbi:hypothetical protein Tco_0902157 [Tanacetum coccineum]